MARLWLRACYFLWVYFPDILGCIVQPTGGLPGVTCNCVFLILRRLLLNRARSRVHLVCDRVLDCLKSRVASHRFRSETESLLVSGQNFTVAHLIHNSLLADFTSAGTARMRTEIYFRWSKISASVPLR